MSKCILSCFLISLVSNSRNMSDKATTDVTNSVEDTKDVSAEAQKFFEERDNVSYHKKLLKLQNMKFKNEADILARFPFESELEVESGVYSWHEYIVLSQDVVQGILEAEWKEMPPATGSCYRQDQIQFTFETEIHRYLVSSDN
jgi:hypothetical protein